MTEKIYWLKCSPEGDDDLRERIRAFVGSRNLLDWVADRDLVAVKTHFGEEGSDGFVRPHFLRDLGQMVTEKGGMPFLTETATLYRSRRSNAVDHIRMAADHGFTLESTGMPVIMADGILGDEEISVAIPGSLYSSVNIAALIVKSQGLLLVSHFTGHLASGFGGALKNLGMGCTSRRGKLVQHSTAKPSIKKKLCTACAECVRWCPEDAITIVNKVAVIERDRCIGCGECLAVCRFDAVGYNWAETYEQLQRKISEHAWGVVLGKGEKLLCLNFLTRITRDCDCMGKYEPIVPDIGVLIGRDPVALDAASLDLIESSTGKAFNHLAYDIPYRAQLDHARAIGFGSPDYQLVEVT